MGNPFFSSEEMTQLAQGKLGAYGPNTHGLHWFAKNNIPLFLFGAGGFGRLLANNFVAHGGDLLGFFDNNPRLQGHLELVGGERKFQVYSPNDASHLLRINPRARLILAVSTSDGQDEILKQADELGIHFEFFVAPQWIHNLAVGNPIVEQVYGYLEDDESRQVYRTLVRRWTGFDLNNPMPFIPNQYFPDFMPRHAYRSFLDAGALDGDTFRRYHNRFGDDFDNYYALEPSPDNFARFYPRNHPKLRLFPLAASDRPGPMRILESHSTSHQVTEGGTEVQSDTLDRITDGLPVTFIKMDIEGCEPAALNGAEKLLREQHPFMAISVYHHPAHLWELPQLIKRIHPQYRLRIRQHSCFMTETICYALPD